MLVSLQTCKTIHFQTWFVMNPTQREHYNLPYLMKENFMTFVNSAIGDFTSANSLTFLCRKSREPNNWFCGVFNFKFKTSIHGGKRPAVSNKLSGRLRSSCSLHLTQRKICTQKNQRISKISTKFENNLLNQNQKFYLN